MSFRFNWNFFNVDELCETAKVAMTEAIAQAKRPPEMVEPLRVVDLDFGTEPPELAFHSIPFVGERRAHVVFRLRYAGDASVRLATLLQFNPLVGLFGEAAWPAWVRPAAIAATAPLVVPFAVSLHSLVLDTLVDMAYTPAGVTVSFRDSPVKEVRAASSLDDIPGVHALIEKTLKRALGESFYEDIPESVWKATSSNKTAPDPSRGPNRWSQAGIRKTRYREFAAGTSYVTPEVRPFDTLALGAHVPHAYLHRQRHGARGVALEDTGETAAAEKAAEAASPGRPPRMHVSDLFTESPAASPRYSPRWSPASSRCSTPSLAPSSPPARGSSPGSPLAHKSPAKHRRRRISLRRLAAAAKPPPTAGPSHSSASDTDVSAASPLGRSPATPASSRGSFAGPPPQQPRFAPVYAPSATGSSTAGTAGSVAGSDTESLHAGVAGPALWDGPPPPGYAATYPGPAARPVAGPSGPFPPGYAYESAIASPQSRLFAPSDEDEAVAPLHRRFSSPGLKRQRKIRTTSLQPASKPRLFEETEA